MTGRADDRSDDAPVDASAADRPYHRWRMVIFGVGLGTGLATVVTGLLLIGARLL